MFFLLFCWLLKPFQHDCDLSIIMKPQYTQRTLFLKGRHGRGVGDGVRDGRAEASHPAAPMVAYQLCGGCIERAGRSLVLYNVEAYQKHELSELPILRWAQWTNSFVLCFNIWRFSSKFYRSS